MVPFDEDKFDDVRCEDGRRDEYLDDERQCNERNQTRKESVCRALKASCIPTKSSCNGAY